MFKGLRTVIYKVADIDSARKWYSALFGIEPYFNEPFYVGFNIGGFELGLDPDRAGVEVGNNAVAYWGVEDAASAVDHALRQGASLRDNLRDVGGGIMVGTVADPDGNVIGIIQNPHFTFSEK